VRDYERVTNNVECVRATFEPLEGRRDVLRSPNFGWDDFEAERVRLAAASRW
jgi:hypothetical protein